ncbi:MAG TPA: DoxX family protein [Flavobacteriia bacterium]|nr:DoxX family protein [Flavobacteriia bacterium]
MKITVQLLLRITVAILLVQTLRFKFTAHPESVYIFSKIGMEPYGRVGIGIFELIAAILLLVPKTVWAGALLTLGIISGALLMHITILGIEVNEDGGLLFYMALLIFVLSLAILWMNRKNLPFIGKKL